MNQEFEYNSKSFKKSDRLKGKTDGKNNILVNYQGPKPHTTTMQSIIFKNNADR